MNKHPRLFNALNRPVLGRRIPDRLYYWLLDRFGGGTGWRPLHMRYPEHSTRTGPWRPASWYADQEADR